MDTGIRTYRGGDPVSVCDSMHLSARTPHPALAPYVERLWYVTNDTAPQRRERRLPTGTVQLLVNIAADRLSWFDGQGRHSASGAGLGAAVPRAVDIDTAEQRAVLGVSFSPGGATAFVGGPTLDTPLVDLVEVWPRAADLRDRLLGAPDALDVLEAFMLDAARDAQPLHPCVAPAARALATGHRVADVADMLGTTTGSLHRRFRGAVGLAPKQFARVARLQRLLGSLTRGADHDRAQDWAQLAATHGWYDQSHLVHDFADLTGMTPTRYRPRPGAWANHVDPPP
ncbi:MAG: helix-turn-helix domain-containing protein [Actinomycetota bacterium]|nr:helix-turn-helix domain-containing protein [Actinomycetota bacterium]